jgi:hypothetical protein
MDSIGGIHGGHGGIGGMGGMSIGPGVGMMRADEWEMRRAGGSAGGRGLR